jgi:cytidylate kinase
MAATKSGDPYEAAHIIERQMLLRYARDKAVRERPAEETPIKYRFVTISRDNGTMGDAIAARLAASLGWHVFDKEIVDHIAENSHVRQSLVSELDERGANLIQDTVGRFLRMAEGGSFGSEDYHVALLRALGVLAVRGSAVLVGRGANFALAGEAEGLHVRIIGSPEIRSRRLAVRWGVTVDEARRRMTELDTGRRSFIRHHFKQDMDSPYAYDQVFNTDRLSSDQVVDALLAAIKVGPELVPPAHEGQRLELR